MKFFWAAVRKTAPTGLVLGTLYFVVIGALTFFTGVISRSVPPPLWFALFVGVGAALGLGLGVLVAVVLSLTLPPVNRRGGDQSRRLRWVGAAAAGLPVLAVTVTVLLTGGLGVLDTDATSVVLVPTLIAAAGGAATAPSLCERYQPKRPEM